MAGNETQRSGQGGSGRAARSFDIAFMGALAVLAGCAGEVEAPRDGAPVPGLPLAGDASLAPGVTAGVGGAAAPGGGPGGPTVGDPSLPTAGESCADAPVDSGAAPLRRLTRLEYALTLQQLLQLPEPPDVEAVPAEAERSGFTVHTVLQTLSAQHLRAYLEVATSLADDLLASPTRVASVIGCTLADATCLDAFVDRFGRLAFRRPLAAEERDTILQAARTNALDATDAYRYAIEALLVSPNFLYRPELGTGGDLYALSPYELAARMSFTLVGHGPSEALLDLAADGTLDTPSGRASAVAMLQGDPAFQALYGHFFREWLGFDRLITPKEPPADWDDVLLVDMEAETEAVVDRLAWGGPGFLDILATDQTRLTPALASFYDLPAPGADGWVQIPAGHPRAETGLLTHASLLSQKSDGDRIAKRGNWLRRTFLCRNLEIPEAVAATFGERLVGLTRTEIVRERNTDTSCRGCHSTIDPIGVGLDAFDDTGRFDPGYVVPDYGVEPGLPDAPDPAFGSVAELASKLRALPEVASCLTERTFLFVHGREPEDRDQCTVQSAEAAFVGSGYDYRALVQGLLDAPAFGMRRTPEVVEGATP